MAMSVERIELTEEQKRALTCGVDALPPHRIALSRDFAFRPTDARIDALERAVAALTERVAQLEQERDTLQNTVRLLENDAYGWDD